MVIFCKVVRHSHRSYRGPMGASLLFFILTFFLSHDLRAEDFTKVPVVINLLMNSGATEENAKKAVEEANKILKQTNIMLTVVKVNKDVKMGDDGNAELTQEERPKVRESGGKEIETTDNKKGIKITFAKTPEAEVPANPGISVHRDPTIIVKERQTGGKFDANATGQTIAHEIGHVLTLGAGHTIDPPKNQAGPPVNADGGGHAGTPNAQPPNLKGRLGDENIMAPSNLRKGTALTQRQIEEIRDGGIIDKVGKEVKKDLKGVGEKRQQQHGAKTDERGDQGAGVAPHLDLFRTALSSELGQEKISALLTLGGLFPGAGPVDASYRLLFDTDASPVTGIALPAFGGFGFDREVRLNVMGDASLAPLLVSGSVLDPVTNAVIGPIMDAALLIGHEFVDLDRDAVPVEHQFLFDIPKNLLGFSVVEVPIGAIAGTPAMTAADMAFLIFDTERWLKDPNLLLFVGEVFPGKSVAFQIDGLSPGSAFDLFLDNDMFLSGTLDGTGAFAGSFIFPALRGDTSYFLTAQDSTGEFAFNVLFVPGPASLLLVAAGLACLGLFRIRAHARRPRST